MRLLNAHEVEYLLVGGYAVAYHGYPRATADMDIWVGVSEVNAERIVATVREFGFTMAEVSPVLFRKEHQVVRMGVPPVRIEILTTLSGVTFPECFRARVVDDMDGVPANLISSPHLKINKRAAGRFKDLDDLENLR